MELAEILKALRRKWLATGLVVVLAVGAAVAVRLTSHNVPTGAATVQLLVDSPSSELANLTQSPTPLISRAAVFAQVMTSQAVLQSVAAVAKVPATSVTAQGPYSGPAESLDVITPAESRSNQLVAQRAIYRLTFLAQQNEPVITTTVQAPTPDAAENVANAVYPGVENYIKEIQRQGHTPDADRVTLRQLGAAQTGTVNSGSRGTLMIAAFLGILILGLLSILGIEGLRKRDRELEHLEHDLVAEFGTAAKDTTARTLATAGERRR
jgi:capsular polysaccharide biosynthesis protein